MATVFTNNYVVLKCFTIYKIRNSREISGDSTRQHIVFEVNIYLRARPSTSFSLLLFR